MKIGQEYTHFDPIQNLYTILSTSYDFLLRFILSHALHTHSVGTLVHARTSINNSELKSPVPVTEHNELHASNTLFTIMLSVEFI